MRSCQDTIPTIFVLEQVLRAHSQFEGAQPARMMQQVLHGDPGTHSISDVSSVLDIFLLSEGCIPSHPHASCPKEVPQILLQGPSRPPATGLSMEGPSPRPVNSPHKDAVPFDYRPSCQGDKNIPLRFDYLGYCLLLLYALCSELAI